MPYYLEGTSQTKDLAKFLQDGWLATDQMDIMSDFFKLRIKMSATLSSKTEFLPLSYQSLFLREIPKPSTAHQTSDEPNNAAKEPASSRALAQLRTAVIEGRLERLFTPANIDNMHWVTIYIDFVTKTSK